MLKSFIFTALFSLLMLGGCSSAPPASSPQVPVEARRAPYLIVVPVACVVTQGEARSTTLVVEREMGFKEGVRLEFQGKGVGITPQHIWVSASDRPEVRLHISTDLSSRLGQHPIVVYGRSSSGFETSAEFAVNVLHP